MFKIEVVNVGNNIRLLPEIAAKMAGKISGKWCHFPLFPRQTVQGKVATCSLTKKKRKEVLVGVRRVSGWEEVVHNHYFGSTEIGLL